MSHTYLLNGTTNPAITAGQVTAVTVSQDAVWIVFHNVSVNQDILLSLGVTNPGPTTTPGGEWPYVCPAGHSVKVPVPGTSTTQTAVAPYWQGKLWVLPINISSQQAVTGQQPPIGNLWIMTFAAGETPAEVAPSSPATAQIGQQRVVSVPIGTVLAPNLLSSVTAATDYGIQGVPLPAGVIARQRVVVYLYYLQVIVDVQAAVAGLDFRLFADVVDMSSSTLTSAQLLEGLAYAAPSASGTFTPFVFAPSIPGDTGEMSWAGVAAQLNIRLHAVAVTGTVNAKINLMAFPDVSNSFTNPPIGSPLSLLGLNGLF